MRIFVAGASGVIGVRLVPLLVSDGHEVTGMTRSPARRRYFRSSGLNRSSAMRSTQARWPRSSRPADLSS